MLEVTWVYGSRLLVVKLLTLETADSENICIKKNLDLLYTVVGRDSKKEAKEDQLWMNENGCHSQYCSPKAIPSHRNITTPREPSMFPLQPPT